MGWVKKCYRKDYDRAGSRTVRITSERGQDQKIVLARGVKKSKDYEREGSRKARTTTNRGKEKDHQREVSRKLMLMSKRVQGKYRL